MTTRILGKLAACICLAFGCSTNAEVPSSPQTPEGKILAVYGDPYMSFRAGSRRLLVYGLAPIGALDVFGSTTFEEALAVVTELENHDPDTGCWLFFELEDPGYVTSYRRSKNCSEDEHPILDLEAVPPVTRFADVKVGTRSIQLSDLPGSWIETNRYATSQTFLIFSSDGIACISERSRCHPKAATATYKYSGVDDLFTVTHLVAGDVRLRYVLGGWKSSKSRVLFGTKYIYYKGEVTNGFSVTLLPVGLSDVVQSVKRPE